MKFLLDICMENALGLRKCPLARPPHPLDPISEPLLDWIQENMPGEVYVFNDEYALKGAHHETCVFHQDRLRRHSDYVLLEQAIANPCKVAP